VCSLSETMSTTWLTPWEAMKSRVGSCRVWETRGKIPGAQIQLAGPAFPRGGGTTNLIIFFILKLLYLYSTHQYKLIDIYMLYKT
jgi:hypothetical protein